MSIEISSAEPLQSLFHASGPDAFMEEARLGATAHSSNSAMCTGAHRGIANGDEMRFADIASPCSNSSSPELLNKPSTAHAPIESQNALAEGHPASAHGQSMLSSPPVSPLGSAPAGTTPQRPVSPTAADAVAALMTLGTPQNSQRFADAAGDPTELIDKVGQQLESVSFAAEKDEPLRAKLQVLLESTLNSLKAKPMRSRSASGASPRLTLNASSLRVNRNHRGPMTPINSHSMESNRQLPLSCPYPPPQLHMPMAFPPFVPPMSPVSAPPGPRNMPYGPPSACYGPPPVFPRMQDRGLCVPNFQAPVAEHVPPPPLSPVPAQALDPERAEPALKMDALAEPLLLSHGTFKRRRKRHGDTRCRQCGTTQTPEWRRGPDGARTLCNACGLYHAKLAKKWGDNEATELLRERANQRKRGV